MNDRSRITVDVTGTRLRATDIAGSAVTFELTGWDRIQETHSFEEPLDQKIAGRVSEIQYDLDNFIGIRRLDGSLEADSTRTPAYSQFEIAAEDDTQITLPDGEYYCRLEACVLARLKFNSEATVRHSQYGGLRISFPHPTPVTFGFATTVDYPRHELTVRPTLDGIATALSHLSASIETTTPDRAHRNYRGYPPLVSLGSDTVVPEPVRAATADTGIELRVPARLDALFPVASLAYYLGARVVPSDGVTGELIADAEGVHHQFDRSKSFDRVCCDLLARTFFLDLMVSWLDDQYPTVTEYERLVASGVDIDHCTDASIAARLATYLTLDDDLIERVLPPWPYRVVVEPTPEHAPVFSHLVHDLAAVDLPGGSDWDRTHPPGQTEDDAGAGSEASPVSESAAALLGFRPLVGYLGGADDGPGFRALLCAYRNRLRFLDGDRESLTVTVVVGPDVSVDGREICDRYTECSGTMSTIGTVLEDPTARELRAEFRSGADFLHLIGSWDEDGFQCVDDAVDPATLDENNVQLFQLDGCVSPPVAERLVETGSVAGVVSASERKPVTVSTIIGQLVLYDQSIATATMCATIEDPSLNATVVGDGSHRFSGRWKPASVQAITPTESGTLDITVVPFPVDPVGAHWLGEYDVPIHLMSNPLRLELEPEQFNEHFSNNLQPVVYDGEFYWMGEQTQLINPLI